MPTAAQTLSTERNCCAEPDTSFQECIGREKYNLTRFALMRDIQNSRLKHEASRWGESIATVLPSLATIRSVCLKVTLLPVSSERTQDELHANRTGRRNAWNVFVFIITVSLQARHNSKVSGRGGGSLGLQFFNTGKTAWRSVSPMSFLFLRIRASSSLSS